MSQTLHDIFTDIAPVNRFAFAPNRICSIRLSWYSRGFAMLMRYWPVSEQQAQAQTCWGTKIKAETNINENLIAFENFMQSTPLQIGSAPWLFFNFRVKR